MTSALPEINPYASSTAADHGLPTDITYRPRIFSFSGRIGRLRFGAYAWAWVVLLKLPIWLLGSLGVIRPSSTNSSLAMSLLLMLQAAGVMVFARRRAHDLGKGGWWVWLAAVPFVNILFVVYLTCFPGDTRGNRFGPPPSRNSLGVQIIGWLLYGAFLAGLVVAIVVPRFARDQRPAPASTAAF